MMYLAAMDWKIKDTYANIAKDASVVPDTWSNSQIWHFYNHYCDPEAKQGLSVANAYTYAIQQKATMVKDNSKMHILILVTQATFLQI